MRSRLGHYSRLAMLRFHPRRCSDRSQAHAVSHWLAAELARTAPTE
ncbi:Uncharacterised protein [Vibrio cholerae]|nr:Uncharacterised protein [Vibrio cholerae]CSI60850.1 Uncharacterised protein [Vibrio cholerae]